MEEMSYFHQRQKEFNYKYDHISRDKEKLLEREIEGHRLILDDKKLDLTVKRWLNEPLENYDIPFSAMRIFLIREFYIHFIAEGNDVLEIDGDEYDSWLFKLRDFALEELSEPFGPKYYYNLANDLKEYLSYLKLKLENYVSDGTIIDSLLLTLIFKKYGSYFKGETLETWLKRFSKEDIEINPINVESEARQGTGRLKLIAILACIQSTTWNGINYENFVRTHFGILGFESTKSRSKDKEEFREIFKDCEKFLKIMK